MEDEGKFSRRDFVKTAGLTALSGAIPSALGVSAAARASTNTKHRNSAKGDRYNILMIVTDQERYLEPGDLPPGFRLPGHERLWKQGVTFENHQIASCVCTPSRAVIYTGQHIQNNGMFDNTNYPWSDSMSTDIDTIGDLLRKQGYYTAYKGKWHLTEEFETTNDLQNPKKLLTDEMEAYGFSDYMGIGDIVGHTEGGYLHDEVISSMSRSWMRGKGEQLRREGKPWFLSVNLVNPHDVMFYNTDLPGETLQGERPMFHINREPDYELYKQQWEVSLPASRKQSITAAGRPAAHLDFRDSNATLLGAIPNEDSRWRRLNNYYFNCIQDADRNLNGILDELERLGIADETIVVFTSDHGELAGAHGLVGKGATAYRQQNNVPFVIAHPGYSGNKRCKAVTSHVDIATTLISFAGGNPEANENLPGKDVSVLLEEPEMASFDTLRSGALYNFNMLGFLDSGFIGSIGEFVASGGSPADLQKQGFKPNLKKRGAIRSIYDGRYKFSRYFSPLEHHVPKTLDQLFASNDVELYDLVNDPAEVRNLALDIKQNGELIALMNEKLYLLVAQEVGQDDGQMLPSINGAQWTLSSSIEDFRP